MIFHDPIVVIGGNAAGAAAAAKAARINPNGKVLMIEKGPYISTGTCELPYLISGEISAPEKLVFFTPASFKSEKGVEVLTDTQVTHIHPAKKSISINNLQSGKSDQLKYSRLIIATGARSLVPAPLMPLPENVFTFKSVTDYQRWSRFEQQFLPKRIAVIGSGFIGLELVTALTVKGYEVTLFEQADRIAPVFDTECSALLEKLVTRNNVTTYTSASRLQYSIKQNRVTAIKLESRKIDFDAVFVANGFQPEVQLAADGKLSIGKTGAIRVSNRMQTSDPEIFAAGDAIEQTCFITGKSMYLPSAVQARNSGYIAGENAAGGRVYGKPVLKNIALPVFGKFLVQVGANRSDLHDCRYDILTISDVGLSRVKVMPDTESVFAQIHVQKSTGYMLGAVFFGSSEAGAYADILATAIINKVPLQNIQEIGFTYTPKLSPFNNLLHTLSRKAQKMLNK